MKYTIFRVGAPNSVVSLLTSHGTLTNHWHLHESWPLTNHGHSQIMDPRHSKSCTLTIPKSRTLTTPNHALSQSQIMDLPNSKSWTSFSCDTTSALLSIERMNVSLFSEALYHGGTVYFIRSCPSDIRRHTYTRYVNTGHT